LPTFVVPGERAGFFPRQFQASAKTPVHIPAFLWLIDEADQTDLASAVSRLGVIS
jgi:hypothetical protein